MSENSIAVWAELDRSAAFQEALAEFVADQKKGLVEAIRLQVRCGSIGQAQLMEGSLAAIEDLPGVIASIAKQYESPVRV